MQHRSIVVLDAAGFDALASPQGTRARAVLEATLSRGDGIWTTAVTVAEVARGTSRTRTVEATLARRVGGQPVRVRNTDLPLAKLVGAILHATQRGSADIADAHVVAACADADVALVFTSDPDDIMALAEAIPGTRVVTRSPT